MMYTIAFGEWPEEAVTYTCHFKVYANPESFPLDNDDPLETDTFEFTLYPMDHYDWPSDDNEEEPEEEVIPPGDDDPVDPDPEEI